MMRTANPALNEGIFSQARLSAGIKTGTMTVQGTVNKTFLLLLTLLITASITWFQYIAQNTGLVAALTMVGVIGGIGLGIATVLKKEWAPVTAPLYAAAQGLLLGGFSSMLEAQFPGIVIQAVGLTFGTLFCLLGAYKSEMIKVTENFKLGIFAATGGIAVFYLVSFVLSFFGVSLFTDNSPLSIGISLVIVVIAALNLVLDFDFIENGAKSGAPKYMEWYAAFGLMVTLVWLYIEILRLLAKLRSRN